METTQKILSADKYKVSAKLQKNILATIAYYDGMDYPLTLFEIWKHLISFNGERQIINNDNFSLSNITKELSEYKLKRFIEEHHGFYFLRGRSKLVEKRITRNKISTSKIKRLRRIVWFLRFVPFLRMIGITGRLAMKNADINSDWDVLIILKNEKIWTGRTLITLLLHVIGKRRYGKKIKDKVCLNHFITDKFLEIVTREIECLFPSNELLFMFPIFDTGIFQKLQLRNSWIKDYKPNFYLNEIENLKLVKDDSASIILRKIEEKILDCDFLEKWLGDWQSRRIMNNPKTHQLKSFVRISDNYLIFLPAPQGFKFTNCLKMAIEKFEL